jgi:hypothetical protein
MKRINLFLVFVVFFNFVFSFDNKAHSTAVMNYAVKHFESRIRKFDQTIFTYSTNEGFVCENDQLKGTFEKITPPTEKSEDQIIEEAGRISSFKEIFLTIIGIVGNAIIVPLQCALSIATLYSTVSSGASKVKSRFFSKDNEINEGDGIGSQTEILAIFSLLILLLGDAFNSWLSSQMSENDFMIDEVNDSAGCVVLRAANNTLCAGYAAGIAVGFQLIKQGDATHVGQGLLTIVGVFAAAIAAEGVVRGLSEIPLYAAKNYFYELSLCGDDWYTYGHPDLEEYIRGTEEYKASPTTRFSLTKTSVIDSKIFAGKKYGFEGARPTTTTAAAFNGTLPLKYYPVKGAFLGSYKYLLDECFSNRNWAACKKLFDDNSINANYDLNLLYSVKRKQYREYIYGGREYAYGGCPDPRPEKANYLDAGAGQLYYYKGSESPNFACERFAISNDPTYVEAFKCCQQASQAILCVRQENIGIHDIGVPERATFCRIDNSNYDIININEEGKSDGRGEGGHTTCEFEYVSDGSNYHYDAELWVKDSEFGGSKYCVETKNFCPYNFAIRAGNERYGNEFLNYTEEVSITEAGEQDTDDEELKALNIRDNCIIEKLEDNRGAKYCNGRCFKKSDSPTKDGEYLECYSRPSNICQVDRHCVTLKPLMEPEYSAQNPYIDKACMNFKGSSHNFTNYKNIATYQKDQSLSGQNLFAPFVECLSETIKNILLNNAGHTECYKAGEIPTGDDINSCPDSGVRYIKGEELNETDFPNPFLKLKKKLENVVRALAALSIILYGFYLISATPDKGELGKANIKVMLNKILRMTFVLYVSTSTTWVRPMFKMVFDLYGIVANKSMEIIMNSGSGAEDNSFYENPSFPGCYFYKNDFIDNNYDDYGDRGYLALFDTLDCKLALYLGYFTNDIVDPPIIGYIFASIFSFGLVIALVFPFIILFIAIFCLFLKIAYSFIATTFHLVLLLFVLPVVFPMMLFTKTKDIFDTWLNNVIKDIMSPVFIMLGAGVFLFMFDKYYIGDVKFLEQKTPIRDFYCGKICKYGNGGFYYVSGTGEEISVMEQRCIGEDYGTIINLKTSAILCSIKEAVLKPTGKGKPTILDSFIENAIRGINLAMTSLQFFNLFIELVFLLILVYLFDSFIATIDKINIFGGGNGFQGDSLSFKRATSEAAKVASGLGNIGTGTDKGGIEWMKNGGKVLGSKSYYSPKEKGGKTDEVASEYGNSDEKSGEEGKKDEKPNTEESGGSDTGGNNETPEAPAPGGNDG